MSDQVTIHIDCENGTASVSADAIEAWHNLGRREIKLGNAYLIAQILIPRIRELMDLSKEALMELHVKAVKYEPPCA